MDGRELHDRRARHAGSGAGAPLRLPPARPVRGADRPARRRLRRTISIRQFRAGAEAVQIFDSWAGVLPPARIRALVRRADRGAWSPSVSAGRAAGADHRFSARRRDPTGKFAALDGLAAIGLDTAVEPRVDRGALPERLALQGNLDPLALLAGGAALDAGIDRVLEASPAAPISSTSATASCPRRRSPMSSGWSRGCAAKSRHDAIRSRRRTSARFAGASHGSRPCSCRSIAAMEALEARVRRAASRRSRPAGSRSSPGSGPTPPARPAAAAGWRCCAGGCSRRSARTFRPCHGDLPGRIRHANSRAPSEDPRFWAAGVSVIAHPWSPHVPTVHMNTRLVRDDQSVVRRRRRSDADAGCSAASRTIPTRSPFTPPCAPPASAIRPSPTHEHFRQWCDEYFFLKHRGEPRGIGGIFFDHLNSAGDAGNSAFDADFAFVRDVGESFLALYCEIVRRNAGEGVERGRARGATGAARTLRRVQPAL